MPVILFANRIKVKTVNIFVNTKSIHIDKLSEFTVKNSIVSRRLAHRSWFVDDSQTGCRGRLSDLEPARVDSRVFKVSYHRIGVSLPEDPEVHFLGHQDETPHLTELDLALHGGPSNQGVVHLSTDRLLYCTVLEMGNKEKE